MDNVKSEKIHLTLTLAEIDALVDVGRESLKDGYPDPDLVAALQKLDNAVNE